LLYLAVGTELPREPIELAEVVRWLIFEQTDLIPMIGRLRLRLLTNRLTATDPAAVRRREGGQALLTLLAVHLREREFMVAGRYTSPILRSMATATSRATQGLTSPPIHRCRRGVPGFNTVGVHGGRRTLRRKAAPGVGRSIYGYRASQLDEPANDDSRKRNLFLMPGKLSPPVTRAA
jgi:hypothetical protein